MQFVPTYFHTTPGGYVFSSPIPTCTLLAKPTPREPSFTPGHIKLIEDQRHVLELQSTVMDLQKSTIEQLQAEKEKLQTQTTICGAGIMQNKDHLVKIEMALRKLDLSDPKFGELVKAMNGCFEDCKELYAALSKLGLLSYTPSQSS